MNDGPPGKSQEWHSTGRTLEASAPLAREAAEAIFQGNRERRLGLSVPLKIAELGRGAD